MNKFSIFFEINGREKYFTQKKTCFFDSSSLTP